MRGQDESEPAPKRQRLDNAGSSSGSQAYAPGDSDQRYHGARNWFTGQGIQNTDGQIGVARDININNNHYGPVAQSHGDHNGLVERRRVLLDSLQFPQMDTRQMSIKQAHAKTCRWFLRDPEYLQWSRDDSTQSQASFLWIKGKPGAGKSTLMKFLLKQTHRARSEGIIISFFFNARGEDMEKSTLGLYQSLLVQLLRLRPSLQRILDRFRNGQPQWNVELLKELFEEALDGLDETSLVCFIDALDECQEQEVRDMIRFLSELSDTKSRFRVCFASRHYPHITVPKGRSIVLEDKDEHHGDIAKYLDSALQIGGGKLSEQIRSDLQEKASGVFMWVVLVVDILNKECDTGQKHLLRNRLRQIPGDLHALFRDILTRDTRNANGLLLCIQWVLFATRPLSPRQLYFAVLAGVEPESLADCHTEDITDHDIAKFILDKSKGLAESTKSKLPTIQFIHESVRDFLLKDNGLQAIWQGDSAHLEGQSHDTLKRACFAYITCGHISRAIAALEVPKRPRKEGNQDRRTDVDRRYPFLEYAIQGVLYHADKAQHGTCSQTDFLAAFPLAAWVKCYNIFEQHHVRWFTSDVSLLYVLSHGDFGALISIEQEDRSCFQVEEERYGTPLFAALALKCTNAVQALIERQSRRRVPDPLLSIPDMPFSPSKKWFNLFGRDFRFSRKQSVLSYVVGSEGQELLKILCATEVIDVRLRDGKGFLPLFYVAGGEHVELASILIDRGGDVNSTNGIISGTLNSNLTPLHHAAEKNTTEMAELLVNRGAGLDPVDSDGMTPLFYASREGHSKMAKILLEKGAEPMISDLQGFMPLHYAVRGWHIETAQLLLDQGASPDATNSSGVAPIHLASDVGNIEMARLLIDRGAHVDAQDPSGWTPLYHALIKGHTEHAAMLIEAGADIHAIMARRETPLDLALWSGDAKVVEFLVAKGTDVNAEYGNHGTLLHWASSQKKENIGLVRLLLEKGANIEALSKGNWTALMQAVNRRHQEIVQLLAEKGANVEATDRMGWTPLHSASLNGSVEMVRTLLEHGANTEASSNTSETPLHIAARHCHPEVTKLLVANGADVNATDQGGRTPVYWASRQGDVSTVRLLLENGADPNIANLYQRMPLDIAGGYGEVTKLLEQWGARRHLAA